VAPGGSLMAPALGHRSFADVGKRLLGQERSTLLPDGASAYHSAPKLLIPSP
jgi:hypothetical protein